MLIIKEFGNIFWKFALIFEVFWKDYKFFSCYVCNFVSLDIEGYLFKIICNEISKC